MMKKTLRLKSKTTNRKMQFDGIEPATCKKTVLLFCAQIQVHIPFFQKIQTTKQICTCQFAVRSMAIWSVFSRFLWIITVSSFFPLYKHSFRSFFSIFFIPPSPFRIENPSRDKFWIISSKTSKVLWKMGRERNNCLSIISLLYKHLADTTHYN